MTAKRPDSSSLLAMFIVLLSLGVAVHAENRSMLLVAVPEMDSAMFSRSVILITPNPSGGAVGVILNHPDLQSMDELVPSDHPLHDAGTIHFGGPVGQGVLVFLFRSPEEPENAGHLFDDVYYSTDSELLLEQMRRPRDVSGLQIYAGYAGWAPGQLQNEIMRGDWSTEEVDATLLFSTDRSSLWEKLALPYGDGWI